MLNEIILRLVEEAKGIEEIEEKVTRLVFELGKSLMKAVYSHLDQQLMKKRKKAADEGERKRVSEAASYISSLSSRLPDWRHVMPAREGDRSPRAMEGNVDKLLADRFKKRGMSWRPAGADCMCQVMELRENGELSSFLSRKRRLSEREERRAMASLRKEVRKNPEAWLEKHMPLLETRSGDPWVKDILKALAGCDRMAC